jgi:hypothetical protein
MLLQDLTPCNKWLKLNKKSKSLFLNKFITIDKQCKDILFRLLCWEKAEKVKFILKKEALLIIILNIQIEALTEC